MYKKLISDAAGQSIQCSPVMEKLLLADIIHIHGTMRACYWPRMDIGHAIT